MEEVPHHIKVGGASFILVEFGADSIDPFSRISKAEERQTRLCDRAADHGDQYWRYPRIPVTHLGVRHRKMWRRCFQAPWNQTTKRSKDSKLATGAESRSGWGVLELE